MTDEGDNNDEVQAAYELGLSDGYETGVSEGYEESGDTGGFSRGYKQGYQHGYDKGYAAAPQQLDMFPQQTGEK